MIRILHLLTTFSLSYAGLRAGIFRLEVPGINPGDPFYLCKDYAKYLKNYLKSIQKMAKSSMINNIRKV